MQNVHITLETLFQTLGLASDEKDMDFFVDHHQLDASVKLENEQRQILANYKSTSEEWTIIIDLLDELLHGE